MEEKTDIESKISNALVYGLSGIGLGAVFWIADAVLGVASTIMIIGGVGSIAYAVFLYTRNTLQCSKA